MFAISAKGKDTLAVKALSTTPPQALELFAEKVRNQALEEAAKLCEEVYGRLAYDTALDAAIAIREMAKEILK